MQWNARRDMIETDRLTLRRWREEDGAPFAAMMADARVVQWLARAPLTEAEAMDQMARYELHFEGSDFGLWAVARKADGEFIGVCGLRRETRPDHPLTPCIQIDWIQARHAWGQGYASEAAGAALMDGFLRHGLDRILACTADSNLRSQRVMERIGMRRAPDRDFDHPRLPDDHPLRPHLVYEIDVTGWMQHLATCALCA